MNPEEFTSKSADSGAPAATEAASATTAAPTPETAPANGSAGSPAVTEARVRDELKNVVDPEIGIDMINLGLVYDVKVDGSTAQVIMTLTSPGCPVAGMFINAVHAAVMSIPGVTDCKVDLTFSPPWDPRTMASEEAKMMLGIYY
ncbi:MAG TPA: metal-sulfur cluster assembly factor [Candidatus Eremiobacteraceae bacterium]|nr:metal-sulfur cluster assembly factor [Candidatus Eremiobacteraceae bacterium]